MIQLSETSIMPILLKYMQKEFIFICVVIYNLRMEKEYEGWHPVSKKDSGYPKDNSTKDINYPKSNTTKDNYPKSTTTKDSNYPKNNTTKDSNYPKNNTTKDSNYLKDVGYPKDNSTKDSNYPKNTSSKDNGAKQQFNKDVREHPKKHYKTEGVQSKLQVYKQQVDVRAVMLGAKVTFSSTWDNNHVHCDIDNNIKPACWTAKGNDANPWAQISCEYPKMWTGVILQGRGDADQWVKSVKIGWSINGSVWNLVDDGAMYDACFNRAQKRTIAFQNVVTARSLRIYPISWQAHCSLRFDATYRDEFA